MTRRVWVGIVLAVALLLLDSIGQNVGTNSGVPKSALSPSLAGTSAPTITIPRIIRFTGALSSGAVSALQAQSGMTETSDGLTATIIFSLYDSHDGQSPLWTETQTVTLHEHGRYSVLLGSTQEAGLPLDLFTSGTALWLGVQPELSGAEPVRVLLVAVPYALKALDADTLGGKPASAFVTVDSQVSSTINGRASTSSSPSDASTGQLVNQRALQAMPAVGGGGTKNFLPIWTSSSNLGNSILFQTNAKNVGIGTTSPAATLDVNGATDLRGTVTLFPPASGSALSLSGTALSVDRTGLLHFVSGQTFPGTGTITGVTPGNYLTGGGSSGNVSLDLNLTATDARYAQLGAPNIFTGNQTINGNFAATGTLSGSSASLTSGLTGTTGNFSGPLTASGGAVFPPTGTTTGSPFPSNPLDLIASSFNGQTNVNQLFRWQSEGNGSANTGTLNLLYASGNAIPGETGLSINNQGLISFASGQTFPGSGSGTVTSVGTGAGLTGGPITSSGTISIASAGVSNGMLANPSLTVGAGTGLTGGGAVALGSSVLLGVDATQIPFLAANNTFAGSITAAKGFIGDGSALVNVNAVTALTAATANNANNLGNQPAGAYTLIGGTQTTGALLEWGPTSPGQPNPATSSPIADSGGTLASTEPISAPTLNTNGTGAGVVQIAVGTTSVTWTLGQSQPSGSCTPGSLYSWTGGGPGMTLWVCEGPIGTWVSK